MIETLGTYAELPLPPREVEAWLCRDDSPWRVTTNLRTGALTATLAGEATGLGRVQITQNRDQDSVNAYAMVAEGNALTLLHGHRAKALTLRPEHVPDAVDAYLREVAAAVPIAPAAPEVQRLVRVDASVTWRHSDTDASRALAQARAALAAQRSGRKILSTHGVETVTLRVTKRYTVRAYDKTAEMVSNARRARVPVPELGPGRLVRLEAQHRSRTARTLYGDNLVDLSRNGALMARTAVSKAADTFASQVTTDNVAEVVRDLVEHGATPAEALRLVGPAMLIAQGGIPALTSIGVTAPTAYRLRARLRDLRGQELSPEDEAASDPALFSIDEAEYADGDE